MKRIQTTEIYNRLDGAAAEGYTAISLQGSARSGKTYNVMIWLILYALRVPHIKISVVRATLPALKGSVLEDFNTIMHQLGVYNDRHFNKTDLVYWFRSCSTIEFFSASDEQRLRGRKRDILFVNEANELSAIQFQQLKMRTSRLTIIDYNPSFTEEHWIAKDFNRDPRTYHFVSTYKDNPFLEQTIIDEIESLQNKNRSLWQIFGEGQMAQIEGLVFTNVETIDAIPEHIKRTFIGIDFGYTNDPTAIVEVAYDRQALYISEICYRTQMLQQDIIRVLKQHPRTKVISESADPRLIEEIYRAGIDIHAVKKYPGSIEAGVAWMLQHPIRVTAHSTNVLKELHNYVYSQDKEGKLLNTPVDAYNHAIDATRYVCMTQWMAGKKKPINLKKLSGIV